MKILDLTKIAIRRVAEAAELVPKRNNVSLPDFDAVLPPQLSRDVYEIQPPKFADIILSKRLNGGRDAEVFDIKNYPEWVLRWEYNATFDPRHLRAVEDNPIGVIASNSDGSVKILKKVHGKPLFEKDWDIFRDPPPEESFIQLRKIEKIPNEAFAKFYDDILELRKNGYQVDTTNPNNILYDKKTQKFNIVDIKKGDCVKPEVTMSDFYPFLDGARALSFYRHLDNVAREDFASIVRNFFDRITKITQAKGNKLEVEEVDHNKFQNFLVYLYRNDKKCLKYLD